MKNSHKATRLTHNERSAIARFALALLIASFIAGCTDEPVDGGSGGVPMTSAGIGGAAATGGISAGGTSALPSGGANAAGAAVAAGAGGATKTGTGAGGSSGKGSGGAAGRVTGGAGGMAGKGGTGGSAGGTGSSHPAPWRIMPLGDSITETTCYPHLLWKKLRDNGHTNFDFVGTKKNNQDCKVPDADQDCEGHSGYKVVDLVNNGPNATELPQWCSADNAEIVLMHFGTNDVWTPTPDNDKIIGAYSSVIDALRAVNPKVIVFMAQIIRMIPVNTPNCSSCACPTCDANVQTLNAKIPNWARSKSTADSPVYVVDLYNIGFDPATETGNNLDGVHPNKLGAQKMADGWYNAIVARNLF